MRALTVEPGKSETLALSDVPEPEPDSDALLVKALAVGLCGTDREIIEGGHGSAPAGERSLVLGHESLGEVLKAPAGSSFKAGDLVVGIVRRPDPAPCAACAAGEWDMCQNGEFTERGIKGAHGFASERFTLRERFAVAVPTQLRETGILLEPTSIVAKAWEQIDRIASHMPYRPRRVLVTGAGPIGLLAALMGVQRHYDVSVLDHSLHENKSKLVRELGAHYCLALDQLAGPPEIVVECTGAAQLVIDVCRASSRNGIVCLTGLSGGQRAVQFSAGSFNNDLVLENDIVFGTVNANMRHYQAALDALQRAPKGYLEAMITRRVTIERFAEAFEKKPGDIKTTLEWT
jgi:threonine dehydrogenase-like Zn-dependent dehydrogenase